jgi:hypothetical protein
MECPTIECKQFSFALLHEISKRLSLKINIQYSISATQNRLKSGKCWYHSMFAKASNLLYNKANIFNKCTNCWIPYNIKET